MRRTIVLIGPMGSGKSAVGAAIAARLSRPLVDTDLEVEREAGATVSEIFEAEGESGFRRREAEAVKRAVIQEGAVIACGGGAVLDPANLAALRSAGDLFYLRIGAAAAAERLAESRSRPLLAGGDLKARLASLLQERTAVYEEAADFVIDAERSLDEVVSEVIRETAG